MNWGGLQKSEIRCWYHRLTDFTGSGAERYSGGGGTALFDGVPETGSDGEPGEAASQLIMSEFGPLSPLPTQGIWIFRKAAESPRRSLGKGEVSSLGLDLGRARF